MTLDQLWEQRIRPLLRLELADQTYDQSHSHHEWVIGLLFGGVGLLFAVLPQTPAWGGYASGVVGGLLGYLIRERWPMRLWRRVNPGLTPDQDQWDGLLDVWVPFQRLAVTVAFLLVVQPPALVVFAIYGALSATAGLYTVSRPGLLHYDVTKDQD